MKDKIEKLLKEKRKTKVDLSAALGVTYQGLQHKLNTETFKYKDIEKMEKFFDVEQNYFSNSEKPKTPELWQELKEQYEKRIKDLEFIVYLYKQEKGAINFNSVSRLSRVRMSKRIAMMKVNRNYAHTNISADIRS